MHPNPACFATSAMNNAVFIDMLVDRPFGGMAILIKQNLTTVFS